MNTLSHPPDTQQSTPLSTVGESLRDRAVEALGNRYRQLTERAARQQLTGPERTELDRIEVSLDTLEAM